MIDARRLLVGAVLLAVGCASPSAEVAALFAEGWEARKEFDPLFATSVGDHRHDDRLPSLTTADRDARRRSFEALFARARSIDAAALEAQDRISLEMFRIDLEERLQELRFRTDQIPFLSDSGFHTALAWMPREMPFDDAEDYAVYCERLRAIPRYLEQQRANMREGLERGMTQPREILPAIIAGMEALYGPAEESLFFQPFRSFPDRVSEPERDQLAIEGRALLKGTVNPAFERLVAFMRDEYEPGARATLGASELPDGAAYYQYLVRHHTTLELAPEEIHLIGRREVERIRAEMEAVIRSTGFEGSFAEFLDFLRTDERFYAETPDALLREAMCITKKMEAELPRLFRKLPRQPVAVRPVPDHLASNYTGGRYVPAPPASTQPGTYWVNTHRLESRPLYVLEALSFHEAVPGHHLQIALAAELTDLPEFRRHTYVNAHGEGWGLYCEKLAREVGFYQDPYSEFGRLTYEMWRACRLVVDTGIHAFGWTRRQARDYLTEHTALSIHEIGTEVDRYVSWPGQALAYKLGELELWRLRRACEEALGERFDLREFHRVVLESGSIPLPALQAQVEAFVAAETRE